MNMIDGALVSAEAVPAVLDQLPQRIARTLAGPPLMAAQVIEACHALGRQLASPEHLALLARLDLDSAAATALLADAALLLNRRYLSGLLEAALGPRYSEPVSVLPPDRDQPVLESWAPWGVLCHIGAGNRAGLPAAGVIEGLLAGNINLLKLPRGDNGLSSRLLAELIRIEPALSDWIYVFDIPSSQTESLAKLAGAADAIVIWGADEAIRAVRQLAPPAVRLIEWGHKTSFAYATPDGATDEALASLADHICATEQLDCSACQGIFLDSDNFAAVDHLAARFLTILDRAAQATGDRILPDPIQAHLAIHLQTRRLEAVSRDFRLYETPRCSVVAEGASSLTPALMFRHAWVRPLPRSQILPVLRSAGSHVQTAALLCGEHEAPDLGKQLVRAGIVRVCRSDNLSELYCGMPHDGEYALRRYMRRVVIDR
jgi:hypothetical protein